MCSIEEAWAGQKFDGKLTSSQGDIHNNYMSLPDNALNRNNEFNVSNPNQPQSRNLIRGVNSKYSREPRVPNKMKSINDMNLTLSSDMPEHNPYVGLEPLPSYMDIYNKNDAANQQQQQYPRPVSTGEHFTDINNAFNISDTLDNFMSRNNSDLLNEDNSDDQKVLNNKFNNKNKFKNVNIDNNTDTDTIYNNKTILNIESLLVDILNKINKLEKDLHHNNKKNVYDIILYVLTGMLLSFIIYSIVSGMKINK